MEKLAVTFVVATIIQFTSSGGAVKDFSQSNLAEHFLKMRVLSKWDPSGRGGMEIHHYSHFSQNFAP